MRNRCIFCGGGLYWGTCYRCFVSWSLESPFTKEVRDMPEKSRSSKMEWIDIPKGSLLVRKEEDV